VKKNYNKQKFIWSHIWEIFKELASVFFQRVVLFITLFKEEEEEELYEK